MTCSIDPRMLRLLPLFAVGLLLQQTTALAQAGESFTCRDGDVGEEDCALNGVCSNGRCVCDPGWTGPRCNLLDLLPPNRSQPHGYYNGSMPTWGGDILYENGKYHAFLTAKGYNEPPYDESDLYDCNTAIVRLEGSGPAGPFEFAEVVLPVFHHEAHAIRAPDGTVLIYMIKYDGGALPGLLSAECLQANCSGYNNSHRVIAVAWSKSVYGPWKEKVILNAWPGPTDRSSFHCWTNCPSTVFMPNGSVVLVSRGIQCGHGHKIDGNEPPIHTGAKISMAMADHWSGPYVFRSKDPVFGYFPPADWPPDLVTPGQMMKNEDPFIWRTHRGYHMLTHCQLLPDNPTRGAYGFSRDALNWTLLPDRMWEADMPWSDGLVSYFQRRQAPGLYLDKSGFPIYLLTPVDEVYLDGCRWGRGWTLMQPIRREEPLEVLART